MKKGKAIYVTIFAGNLEQVSNEISQVKAPESEVLKAFAMSMII